MQVSHVNAGAQIHGPLLLFFLKPLEGSCSSGAVEISVKGHVGHLYYTYTTGGPISH